MDTWQRKLEHTLAALPGVRFTQESDQSASSFEQDNDQVSFNFSFSNDDKGVADRLLVLYLADRFKLPVEESAEHGSDSFLTVSMDVPQAKQFGRSLEYASELGMADQPPKCELDFTPLSVLLSHAIVKFTRDYSSTADRDEEIPSLPVWSNLLCILDRKGVEQRLINRKSVISTRTRKVIVQHCQSLGWIEIERSAAKRRSITVRLTQEGERMKQLGRQRILEIEGKWKDQFSQQFDQLRSSLQTIVRGAELQYPYYITGYGPGDDALTGGNYLPKEKGPPRIPGRGTEWPVVVRESTTDISNMPLSALLSQTLTAIAIDYEMEDLGRLGHTELVFQYLSDQGQPLSDVRKLTSVTGNGRSLHERHMDIVLEPGKPSDKSRLVYPTPKTRRARDSYPFLLRELEARWTQRFGLDVISDLREALEDWDRNWPDDLPDYPNTTAWMTPWFSPFIA